MFVKWQIVRRRLLLGSTEKGKFKNARIVLHNAVDYFDG